MDFMKPRRNKCLCDDLCPFETDCSIMSDTQLQSRGDGLKICASTDNPPLVVPFPEPYSPKLCCCNKICLCKPNVQSYNKGEKMYQEADEKKSGKNEAVKINDDSETVQKQLTQKKNEKKTNHKKEKRDSEQKEHIRAMKEEPGHTGKNSIAKKSQTSLKTDPKLRKEISNIEQKEKDDFILQYLEGMYPGVHVGHRDCVDPMIMVPSTMGWLWNLEDTTAGLEPRRGWRPGAIDRVILRLIRRAKRAAGISLDSLFPTTPGGRRKQRTRPTSKKTSKLSISKESGQVLPTLLLHKTKGKYHIAMNPRILDEEDEVDVQKPIEISVVPKQVEGSDSGSSTDSSLEVQLICPGAIPKKPPQVDIIDKELESQAKESKPTTQEKKKKKATK